MQVGVLQHLTGNAEEAWQELGHAAERLPEVGHYVQARRWCMHAFQVLA